MAERIAMLGGTFNPVHLAHLRSAVELKEALALDRVHMVPCHVPPHRDEPAISAVDRLAMLTAGIDGASGLLADDRELRRDGPSWSLDTLCSLREEYGPEARLVMAIGDDAFERLDQWRSPTALFDYAHLVVIARPGHRLSLPDGLGEWLSVRRAADPAALFDDAPAGRWLRLTLPSPMAISSTDIRSRLCAGNSIRFLVPRAVERYIQDHGLYDQ